MRILIVSIVLALAGCTMTPVTPMGPAAAQQQLEFAISGQEPAASLFTGDAALLSDADIDRILRYQYRLPRQSRVAVLALGQERWFGFSDELARSGEEVRTSFLNQIRTAPSIASATYLPALLIPTNRSVPYFREAATRFQADLLVIYQASCRTYEKFRFFSANTSRSYCNVEAVLLDVRTGIVPFTTSATQEFVAAQQRDDANLYETMRKAELSSIRDGLTKVGTQIAAYLSSQG